MRSKAFAALLALCALLMAVPCFAALTNAGWVAAPEQIRSFAVSAVFSPNGDLTVQENISVTSYGVNIKKGIFRTLPLIWQRADGKSFAMQYDIKEVRRAGVPEPFSTESSKNTLSIRIGSAERDLPPGQHDYSITYTVKAPFTRFEGWDELYWNVTGNGWNFPIMQASFKLSFVDALGKERTVKFRSVDFYTGKAGEKGQNAQLRPDGAVETTAPLGKGAGLTVAYTWDPSVFGSSIAPLEEYTPHMVGILPSLKSLWLWLFPLAMCGYFYNARQRAFMAAGLAGKRTEVIPLFSPPSGATGPMRPGALRYALHKKYDSLAFAADLLSLVSKGAVSLKKDGKTQSLVLDAEQNATLAKAGLSNADKEVLKTLYASNRLELALDKSNMATFRKVESYLGRETKNDSKDWFISSGKYILPGILLVLALPILLAVFYDTNAALSFSFITLFVGAGSFILLMALSRNMFHKVKGNAISKIAILVFCAFFLGNVGIMLVNALPEIRGQNLPDGIFIILPATLVLCIVGAILLPKRSGAGEEALSYAKGMALYLGTAEENRFATLYPPSDSVERFETLLPYAMALDVGETWANRFASYLSATGASAANITDPSWSNLHSFAGCASAASASASSSGSSRSGSGSGGGGSSGGGGGGGGGGGW